MKTVTSKNAEYFRAKTQEALKKNETSPSEKNIERVRNTIFKYIEYRANRGEFYAFITPAAFIAETYIEDNHLLFNIALGQVEYFESLGFECSVNEDRTYIEINW